MHNRVSMCQLKQQPECFMQKKLEDICSHFHIYGDFVVAIPCGNGHINDTYQLTFDQGGTLLHYTLQRINTNVFRQPALVMENFNRVTTHILSKIRKERTQRGRPKRRTLRLVFTHDAMPYYRDRDGEYWRCYEYLHGFCMDAPESAEDFYENSCF